MDLHESRRIPIAWLYAALVLLFVWAMMFRIPMSMSNVDTAFRPDVTQATAMIVGWPDLTLDDWSRDFDKLTTEKLLRGDRLLTIDGQTLTTPAAVVRYLKRLGVGGTVDLVVARKHDDGREERIASTLKLQSVAQAEHALGLRVLVVLMCLVMPWLSLAVGFWVAAVRPRDPMAWLVLLMLLGFSQMGVVQGFAYLAWPDWLRVPGALYQQVFGSTWPMTFMLFGVYFGGRLKWEQRFPWIKWVLLGPMALMAAGGSVIAIAEALDLRTLAPLTGSLQRAEPLLGLIGSCTIGFFFMVMGWKGGVIENPDARRRIRLLNWGATAALSPLFGLLLFSLFFKRPFETIPIPWIVAIVSAVPIFPLTLAYVILVDRAMDVRVAVRQGLRYALTRGTIRVIVVAAIAAAAWNLWILANDASANRPRKLQAMALAIGAAFAVPRVAKRGLEWTDKRFFREAYDAEVVLTSLSEEVRTMVETEPLLDTVLDRIGSTLHVDKLVVFLLDNGQFVPVCCRGFDLMPAVAFPAGADAIRRLAESGKPARIRHEDTDSPLRREAISEENRSRLAQVDAEILLPLIGKKELLGAITLGPKKSEEPYSLSDAKLLGLVATQAGFALENSRLTTAIAHEIAKRERMSRDIEIARDVQQKLFPQRMPQVPGFDCAGYCRPAQGVGGDYYDFLSFPGQRLGIALGDVAGKGIPAALLMASLQASLRGQRLAGPANLAQLMTNLNYLIYEASPDNRYATFFYGELDTATLRMDFVNAGHNAPMIFRAASGAIERLPASGPVIGLVDAGRFEQRTVRLEPGDLLLVYSDGISEAMNRADEEWGEERLAAAARAAGTCDAQSLIEALFTAADAFAAGAIQHDDMTVVVVRVAPPTP
jgi:sigma-B regulation protein RsbU (phosphoserine phosphatase)